ncbi:GMC oxidoreductase [Streptomyces sp. HUAS TT11]|uniref:GMC oxidoreductase n=1 Tax=Streptomyces sp. HUAS TT11 TaxID=3447508 RepID=UPI003F65C4B1
MASIGQAGAFLSCADGAEAPDVELTPMLVDLLGNGAPGFSCLVTLLAPESRGTVRLASTDPVAAPLIDPRYSTEAAERELMVDGMCRTPESCESPIMRALIGSASYPTATDDVSLPECARESRVSIKHPASTCRATEDEQSVVDPTAGTRQHGAPRRRRLRHGRHHSWEHVRPVRDGGRTYSRAHPQHGVSGTHLRVTP